MSESSRVLHSSRLTSSHARQRARWAASPSSHLLVAVLYAILVQVRNVPNTSKTGAIDTSTSTVVSIDSSALYKIASQTSSFLLQREHILIFTVEYRTGTLQSISQMILLEAY